MVAFLSGRVRGVGVRTAERVLGTFGEETVAIIEGTPRRLAEVGGIGERRAASIAEAWRRDRPVRELMGAVQKRGHQARLGLLLHRRHGEDALRRFAADPEGEIAEAEAEEQALAARIVAARRPSGTGADGQVRTGGRPGRSGRRPG